MYKIKAVSLNKLNQVPIRRHMSKSYVDPPQGGTFYAKTGPVYVLEGHTFMSSDDEYELL